MRTLQKRGLKVQGFKVGPDYIDPLYYEVFTGRSRKGRNLDLWMLNENVVLELFERNSIGTDIAVIEGVMGLFDGAYPDDKGSTAHLARVLKAPVLLVVNVKWGSTSIAAAVLEFKLFDPELKIEGVILIFAPHGTQRRRKQGLKYSLQVFISESKSKKALFPDG